MQTAGATTPAVAQGRCALASAAAVAVLPAVAIAGGEIGVLIARTAITLVVRVLRPPLAGGLGGALGVWNFVVVGAFAAAVILATVLIGWGRWTWIAWGYWRQRGILGLRGLGWGWDRRRGACACVGLGHHGSYKITRNYSTSSHKSIQ